VWPGLAAYRVLDGTSSAFSTSEIPSQVSLTRTRPAGTGHVLYNTTWTLTRNGGAVATSLADLYRTRAILPAFAWLDTSAPPAPVVAASAGSFTITPGAGEQARWWVVRSLAGGSWTTRVLFGSERSFAGPSGTTRVIVNAVDAAGNLSSQAEWRP
jgi:hypothetical protein